MFREMKCPRPDCDANFQYTNVREHFKSHSIARHEPCGKNSRLKEGILNIGNSDYFFNEWNGYLKHSPMELELHGHIFLFIIFRDHSTSHWHFYTTIVGSKMNAEKFQFLISLTSQNVSILEK